MAEDMVHRCMTSASSAQSDTLTLVAQRSLADLLCCKAKIAHQNGEVSTEQLLKKQAIDCLIQSLRLAHGKWLDRAGCFLTLSSLVDNPTQRKYLWSRGVKLLAKIEALSWLTYPSNGEPPSIANPPYILILL